MINELAHSHGYTTETIVLYQDMTSRDLFQQRITQPNGDTGWNITPLISAALKGHMAILDGIHRLDTSTASSLKRYLTIFCAFSSMVYVMYMYLSRKYVLS